MPEEDGSASHSDEDRPAVAEAAAERPAGEEQKEDDNDEGDDSDEGFLHCICLDLYPISLRRRGRALHTL
jgi:hypothetical protein